LLNSLDVILIIVVLIGAYWGFSRGLLAEMISLIGVLVGMLAASRFYLTGTDLLLPLLSNKTLTMFITFMLIYILSVLLFFVMFLVIKSNMAARAIPSLSRFAGALIGTLKSAVLMAMIIFLIVFFWGADNASTSGSKLLPHFLPNCRPVISLLPGTMEEPLNEYLRTLTEKSH